jgi:hypothetical protein
LSIRLYVPRVITCFQEEKTLVVPVIIPPREKTLERQIAGWAVADLVVGERVEELVGQPGWVVFLLRETGGGGILAGQGDSCKVVLGIG